jgi:hypothetical protein
MANLKLHHILNVIIASVWLINGLIFKIFNVIPRHEQIVGEILSTKASSFLTFLIGLGEVALAFWILSKYKSKLCTIFQITIIGAMNIIEFIVVPELLLWGKLNIVFAFAFMGLIYFNEYILKNKFNYGVS